jgi:excisionase family DNA binding protein
MKGMDEYLTRKEVAALLRVTPETVSDWVKAGKIKAVKVGRLLLISKSSLAEVVK